VWPGDLAPDDADLGALDGPLSTVDVCGTVNNCLSSQLDALLRSAVRTGYALAAVPVCRSGVIDALELQQRCAGVGVALSTNRERELDACMEWVVVPSLVAVVVVSEVIQLALSARCALTKCAFP
jgi:hypothetical protein